MSEERDYLTPHQITWLKRTALCCSVDDPSDLPSDVDLDNPEPGEEALHYYLLDLTLLLVKVRCSGSLFIVSVPYALLGNLDESAPMREQNTTQIRDALEDVQELVVPADVARALLPHLQRAAGAIEALGSLVTPASPPSASEIPAAP